MCDQGIPRRPFARSKTAQRLLFFLRGQRRGARVRAGLLVEKRPGTKQ